MFYASYAKTQMTVFKDYDIKKHFSTKHANAINLLFGEGENWSSNLTAWQQF